MEKFYVTTPIYYVNDRPHIGHTLTTVLADIITRFKQQQGLTAFLSVGTDEHGLKIKQAAEKTGMKPQDFANVIAADFKAAWDLLDIDYGHFLRTTDPLHKKLAQHFLWKLYDKKYIYKGTYEGLYCIGCEKFLTGSDLNEDNVCPLHKPEQTIHQKEENYFFKLAAFAAPVKKLILSDELKITPEERKREILARIEQGVEDISISREKLEWGVPVPWDKSQTIYVWVEALLNYWTIPQIADKKYFWPPDLQTLAKEILWFHGFVWPAMLLAAEEELPKSLLVHSFYMIDGRKMSKTLGNVITPQQLEKRYGVDGTRYLLAKSTPFADDSDIGLEKFDAWYNADLANGLGNLVARVATLAQKADMKQPSGKIQSDFYPKLIRYLDKYRFDLAVNYIWDTKIKKLDKTMEKRRPWELEGKQLQHALYDIVREIVRIAYNLQPFMPETADKIIKQFSGTIEKHDILFPRMEPHVQARGSKLARPNMGRTSRTREQQPTNPPTAKVSGSLGTGID